MGYIGCILIGSLAGAYMMALAKSSSDKIYSYRDMKKALEDKVFWYLEYRKLEKKVKYWKGFHKQDVGGSLKSLPKI